MKDRFAVLMRKNQKEAKEGKESKKGKKDARAKSLI
jgi:hypothetical protein